MMLSSMPTLGPLIVSAARAPSAAIVVVTEFAVVLVIVTSETSTIDTPSLSVPLCDRSLRALVATVVKAGAWNIGDPEDEAASD
jgi:hypothetical protein